jgi:hypothetical protein
LKKGRKAAGKAGGSRVVPARGRVVAIVQCDGTGEGLGTKTPKPPVRLRSRPLAAYAVCGKAGATDDFILAEMLGERVGDFQG